MTAVLRFKTVGMTVQLRGALLLISVAVAVACSQPPPASTNDSAAQTSQPAATTGVAARPRVAVTKAPDAIATRATNWQGIVADVMEFRRTGKTLTATIRLRCLDECGLVESRDYSTYVLDESGGKKYAVLKDEQDNGIAGGFGTVAMSKGEERTLWAKFPAPPPDVTSASLVFTATEPFEGLPIQDR
jgi:hypothetical protein